MKWCNLFKYSKYNLSLKTADRDSNIMNSKIKNVADATSPTYVVNRQSSDVRYFQNVVDRDSDMSNKKDLRLANATSGADAMNG